MALASTQAGIQLSCLPVFEESTDADSCPRLQSAGMTFFRGMNGDSSSVYCDMRFSNRGS